MTITLRPRPVIAIALAIGKIEEEGLPLSRNFRKAGDRAFTQLTEFGLGNAKLAPCGPFGRGCSNDRCYAQALTPTLPRVAPAGRGTGAAGDH